MPKNYQISQYEEPLAEHGRLEIAVRGRRARHPRPAPPPRGGRGQARPRGDARAATASQVDFNRAGVPLMEIVSEPDLRSPEEAAAYLRALRAILIYLGVCDGNMEEGSLRCDANVSLRPRGRGRARHQGRDQEPELVPVRPARARVRGRAPGARPRGGRAARAGDAALGSRPRARPSRCARRSTRTTTATSPSPTCRRSPSSRAWIEEIARACPSCRRRAARASRSAYGLSPYDADLLTQGRGLADYFEEAAARRTASPRSSPTGC